MLRRKNGAMSQDTLDVDDLGIFTLLDAHAEWLAYYQNQGGRIPWRVMVRDWQRRAVAVEADTRSGKASCLASIGKTRQGRLNGMNCPTTWTTVNAFGEACPNLTARSLSCPALEPISTGRHLFRCCP